MENTHLAKKQDEARNEMNKQPSASIRAVINTKKRSSAAKEERKESECGTDQPLTIVTLPINADEPPRRAIPTATLAGAPPGAFLNAGASAKEIPLVVGTKSISISPKQTTSESFASRGPLLPASARATKGVFEIR